MSQVAMRKAINKRRERKQETLGTGAYERQYGKLVLDGEDLYEKFEIHHEQKPSTKDAQGYFLEAVQRLVPKVLEDLSGEPYRLYKQTDLYFESNDEREPSLIARYLWNRDRRPSWEEVETPPPTNHPLINYREFWQCSPVDTGEHILAFRKRLLEWSRDHKLDEVWCRARAYDTLDWWCASPEAYQSRFWHFQINYHRPFMAGGEPRFVFERRTQYPLLNSRIEDFERAVEEFKRQYSEFQDKLDTSIKADGYAPAPVKPLDYHFEWLVRYHLQEWKYSSIAAHYSKTGDDGNIRHTVPKIASLIGLTIKRRGRPRKN